MIPLRSRVCVKIKRKRRHRVHRMYLSSGQRIVLYPLCDEKTGRLHEFVMLGETDPLPVMREESATFLRVH
jgi:hypothetical protein